MIALPDATVAARRLGGELSGGEILCPGPNHSDQDRSLSVKLDADAPDGFVCNSFCGDDPIKCRDYVRSKLSLPPFEPAGRKRNGGGTAWKIISVHVYNDENNEPYLRVRKCIDEYGKRQFPQSHWDSATGKWAKGKPKGPKIPYRLPELRAAPADTTIYIAEGEKCCDALAKLGFIATTNSEGADGGKGNKWTADLNKYFKDRSVVIVADNDRPGRSHVQHVAKSLHGVSASVRTLDLAQHWPGEAMPDGADVFDWIEQHDRAGSRLAQLAKDGLIWEPGAEPVGGSAGDDASTEDDAEIARLAKLSALEYERERKAAAERLGVRAAILDRLVEAERIASGGSKAEPASSFLYDHWEVEPWPEAVDGEILFRAIVETLHRYLVLDGPLETASTLWLMQTWLHERIAVHSPILLINSPLPGSGKTTLVHLIAFLARRGLSSVSITGAALFRSIEKWSPTISIDDADLAFVNNADLTEVVNSGWTRGDCVIRCDPETHDPRPYKTFCPKAIGMIGRRLPPATFSRCLLIPMRRKRPDEHADDFEHIDNENLARLRSQLLRWAEDSAEALAAARPEIPPGLHNRARMNWRVLLSIAELCRAKKAAWEAVKTVEEISATVDPELAAQLLSDIRDAFDRRKTDRLPTKALLHELIQREEGPWLSYGKAEKPITGRNLSGLLKDFRRGKGIRPKTIRLGPNPEDTIKGYERADFEEDFKAYLPPKPSSNRAPPPFSSVTSVTSSDFNDLEARASVTRPPDVTEENSSNPLKTNDVTDVTDKKGGETGEGGCAPDVTDEKWRKTGGRCAQCNGLAADAPLVTGDGYPPAGVHLHEECRKFWLRSHHAGGERFRKVDDVPPGTPCRWCQRFDGEVLRLVDARVVGGRSEPLHLICAPSWWGDG